MEEAGKIHEKEKKLIKFMRELGFVEGEVRAWQRTWLLMLGCLEILMWL